MLSQILSFIGWSFLPDLVTLTLLPLVHRHLYVRLWDRTPPSPNTPLWRQHYRFLYAITVFAYLCYNFREAATSMPPNYYELLGVEPIANGTSLKLAFRQFARKNHPDRVGPQGAAAFIEVRDAFEALKNPVTRSAYDKFGPEVLQWTHCSTLHEYIRHGLMQSAGFYIVAICVLLLWSVIGRSSNVTFWRYLLFVTVFTYELVLILSPSPTSLSPWPLAPYLFPPLASNAYTWIFALLWPRRVAFQHIRFLHSFFLFLSIALSRVAPVMFPSPPQDHPDIKQIQGETERLNMLARLIDHEVSLHIQMELHSVHGPPTKTPCTGASFVYTSPCPEPADEVMALLTTELENMIIEGQMNDGGPLKSAVDSAVAKRVLAEEKKAAKAGMPSPTPTPPPSHSLRKRDIAPLRRSPSVTGHGEEGTSSGYVRGRSKSY